jgi:hypothetical protein
MKRNPSLTGAICQLTKTGLEVDFILGRGEVAVEVKGSSRVDSKDMKPLFAFCEEYSPRKAIIVCNEKKGAFIERSC